MSPDTVGPPPEEQPPFHLSAFERGLIHQHVLQCSATALLAGLAPTPTPAQQTEIDRLITARNQDRVPLQYLLGEGWFYGRAFAVTPAVLIPRPETELLVEAVLNWIAVAPPQPHWNLVDVGTGSGCIAITLALELARRNVAATVWGVDISEAALAVARQNARALGARVEFMQSNLLADLLTQTHPYLPTWDVVVSNPPYIDPALEPTLMPEVRCYEPRLALFADQEGYALAYQLGQQALTALRPGGLLAVEVGQGMATSLANHYKATHWRTTAVLPDYNAIERMVLAESPFQ